MATEAKEVKVIINRNAANAIASAIARGIREVNGTGGLLHSVCKLARAQYRGKPMPDADIGATLDQLVETMGWKGDRTKPGTAAATRCSEYRAVLSQYAQLEETMKSYLTRAGKCTWHDGIALSRLLRKGANPNAAAKQHASRKSAVKTAPSDVPRAEAKGYVAMIAKRVLKLTKLEADFRNALRELCEQHSIKV